MLNQSTDHASPGARSARRLCAILSGLAFTAIGAVAFAGTSDIEVVSVRGDVRITTAGAERAAKAGTTLDLPSTVRTGKDGVTDLRQGDTTIGIGPGSQLEFPAPSDAPADRIVQGQGNSFYNVGPRGSRRLRVETPFLVAVIKGTQFNVSVEPDSSTISLHEGSLEVLAPDIGASIELKAGEIAMRHRGDDAIRVLPMRDRGVPAATTKTPGTSASVDGDVKVPAILDKDTGVTPVGSKVTPIDPIDGTIAVDTEVDAKPLPAVQVDVDAGVDAGAGAVDVAIDAGVDAGVDPGAGTVDTSLDVGVDAGAAGVDAGVAAGVDAGVDLGAGTVDTSLDVGVDAGVAEVVDVGVDAGVDAGVDLGAGTVDTGVDVGIDTGLLDADVSADVGADLTGADAGIDIGLDVLDTGIDVGLGGESLIDVDVDTSQETEDTGGLLGGVLRRIGL